MSVVSRFVSRSKKSGEKGFGILLDGACYAIGHGLTGLKMNNYFFRKEMQKSRWGWTIYFRPHERDHAADQPGRRCGAFLR